MRVHLDTDLGSDPDDVCALAMLLGWPDAEVVGVTTCADPGGQRAGCVAYCLDLAGRGDIPVAAGAASSLTHGTLAVLERASPGSLQGVPVVVMGGWIQPPDEGLPQWGPERDWNVQGDTRATEIVACTARLTLSTLPVSLKAQLRAADLPRLRALGPLGELAASQSAAHGADTGKADLGPACRCLPDDLLNFHYDPVACAVALGWSGATVEEMRLRTVVEDGVLRFEPDESGRLIRVVTDVDGPLFRRTWFAALTVACGG